MPSRILIATFGSAGDLFPLVRTSRLLLEQGHDVKWAAPRGLGLYLRHLGMSCISLGTGAEMRFFRSSQGFDARFGGWASWRRTAVDFIAPTLETEVEQLERVFHDWRPDRVVASSFATSARIAAVRNDIPHIDLSMYPQHLSLIDHGSEFAAGFLQAVEALVSTAKRDQYGLAKLAWGVPPDGLLHDEWLLRNAPNPRSIATVEALGFPYWDQVDSKPEDIERVHAYTSSGAAVIVTLGSFLGATQQHVWIQVAGAVSHLNRPVVFVGVRSEWRDTVLQISPRSIATDFIPLGGLYGRAAAIVHHGGLGTLFGCLRAGTPSVILPQAFDQPFNAQLAMASGAAETVGGNDMGEVITEVIGQPQYRAAAADAARSLTSAASAAAAVQCLIIHDL